MLVNSTRELRESLLHRWDVCVVGAGAAGITLAAELKRSGVRVLILESGSANRKAAGKLTYDVEHIGPKVRHGALDGRVQGLGGTTTAWGGQISPLDPIDFAERWWIPNSGWPFDDQTLSRFYSRALGVEGLTDAIQTDEAVWRAAGIQPPFDDRAALLPYFTRWCPKPDFWSLHGQRLIEADNVVVAPGVRVVSAHWRGNNLRAVEALADDGQLLRVEADSFIVATGGLESVRMLLQPAFTPPDMTSQTRALVGTSVQDHVDADIGQIAVADYQRLQAAFANVHLGGLKYHLKWKLAANYQEEERTVSAAATINFPYLAEGGGPGLGLKLVSAGLSELSTRKLSSRSSVKFRGAPTVRVHLEQAPKNDNRISLSGRSDATGLPLLQDNWRVGDEELRAARVTSRAMRALIEEREIGEFTQFDSLDSPDKFARAASDANHHIGGLRMTNSCSAGVVNENLLVHGSANLYVCSAAVFPTGGFSNPTHTVIALAVRLAEGLAAKGR